MCLRLGRNDTHTSTAPPDTNLERSFSPSLLLLITQEALSPQAGAAPGRVPAPLALVLGVRVHGGRLPEQLSALPPGGAVSGHTARNVPGRQRGNGIP